MLASGQEAENRAVERAGGKYFRAQVDFIVVQYYCCFCLCLCCCCCCLVLLINKMAKLQGDWENAVSNVKRAEEEGQVSRYFHFSITGRRNLRDEESVQK